jgi:DNA-binding NtrC family response regulator
MTSQRQAHLSGAQSAVSGLSPNNLYRLLVIDDDRSMRGLIEQFGKKAGFITTTASSITDASQLLRDNEFDCITLDLSLGKETGIAVLRILAEIKCSAQIIIISGSLPSGRELAKAIGNMMKLNLLKTIAKPIDSATLRTALAGVKQQLDLQTSRMGSKTG